MCGCVAESGSGVWCAQVPLYDSLDSEVIGYIAEQLELKTVFAEKADVPKV